MKPQPSPANLLNEIGSRGGNVQQDHARGPGRKASGLEARKENMSSKHWLVSYGDRIPSEINPHAYSSVLEMLERAMTRFADKPAFRCFGQALTYADTDRLSRHFAGFLQRRLGVKKGDRVAVMLPNIPAFAIAMIGILRAGAVQVNVNPLYTARELEHQLNDAGAEVIVIFSGVSATLAEIIGKTRIRHVISAGLSDGTGIAIASPAVDGRLTNSLAFTDALMQGADLALTPVTLCPDDLIFLQYTGGTTGVSKGAALSHGNLVANTEQFKAFVPDALRPGEEVIVTALPLYHIFALMVNFIGFFSIGAENWLVPNPRDFDGFCDILKTSRFTAFTGVNTLYGGMTMHPRETSPILTLNPMTNPEFSATVGLPMPSTDIKLLDADAARRGG
jgi:long-chain acyl-CoA synthetase